jgi:flavorubredoxin
MNSLIVYESGFGNTRRIAEAIAATLRRKGNVRMIKTDELNVLDFRGVDLVVVGCPTHDGGMPEAVRAALAGLPSRTLRGLATAAFDTRYRMPRWRGGSAARRVAWRLRWLGGARTLAPESFFVVGPEGPLGDGELERATRWAEAIVGKLEGQVA